MESVWLALIVAIPATLSPLLLSLLTNRNRRQEKREDYARQDEVADRAEANARLVLQKQDEVAAQARVAASLLERNNRAVAESAAETKEQLTVIHTLVNSSMTAAMQDQLDAHSYSLILMHEVIGLKRASGHDPSIETLAAIKTMEEKIGELKTGLAARKNPS